MIIELTYEKDTPNGMNIIYTFTDTKNNSVVATARDCFNENIMLTFDTHKYEFSNLPKFIIKPTINFLYPTTSKRKKTIGFNVTEGNHIIAFYYQEAAKCKKGLFGSNIGFTVFGISEEVYMLFKVGFKDDDSHYYCLYNNETTIAVIERHNYYDNNCKATIYIEDESALQIALIACTEEIISVANSGGKEFSIDSTAGRYISMLEEEKALFDREFIQRVKAE